ncbi:MAG: CBS domain-containing protein [Actinobacteria bacterium]|nr:CBS domain-containing protein [Actinomycetota bacterium]
MQLSTIIGAKGGNVVTIQPDASVADLVAMLAEHNVGALVVSADGRTITGIVSERDVVHSLSHGPDALQRPVASIMTSTVFCAPPEAHVDELMHLMTEKRVRHIPVTDPEGILMGIVSIGDVVKSRLSELEGERQALLEYITKG